MRAAQAAASGLAGGRAAVGCDEEAERVEVAEAWEARDEDELERFAPRGMNRPAALGTPSAVHAWRLML